LHRKLAAIVAADIVGYSKRLSENERGTLAAIAALRREIFEPQLAPHSGRIFRLIGDSTLLEFDSALGAVDFAIGVQQSLAIRNATEGPDALILRMGVDLGDVLVEQEEIHGEGVNIAVRLEEIAEPGGICLSDNIHAQIRNRIDAPFFPIGPRVLKNIAQPVQAWRWRPQKAQQSRHAQFSYVANDRQEIDPRVTELILALHARSAQLAVSNALDDVLSGTDDERLAKTESFYERIGNELALARAMLGLIQIEPAVEFQEICPAGRSNQSLTEFINGILEDRGRADVFRLVRQAQTIMRGEDDVISKRRLFLDMVRKFHYEEFIVRSKGLIKTAFTTA
jgi:class 3 adenylate cyclase